MRSRTLCLLIVSLMLGGCASSKTQLMQPTPVPPLASDLAQPCDKLVAPSALDYDVWQSWVTGTVLPAYATCAQRHASAVAAWPKVVP